MRLLAPLLLLATAAGFAWIAALPWLLGPARTVGTAGDPAPVVAPLPSTPDVVLATDLAPFQERPLFSAARRPPPPEAPGDLIEDPMADMLFGRFEISGVVKLGDKAIAMLRDARDGTLLRIRVGDQVGDADVVEITLESLTFRNGGDTVIAPVTGDAGGTGTE